MQHYSRRNFLRLALGTSAAFALPTTAFAEGGSIADIKKRGKLVVGTEAAYEPFEFVENGQVVGFGRDILVLMADKLGVELEQMNLPFQGLLPGLMSHKFDFVATSVSITPERAKRFAFSQPVGVVRPVLMARVDDTSITRDLDLAGKVLGTQMGSSSQPAAEQFEKTLKEQRGKGYADTKLFQAYPDVAIALNNKTVDVAFIPSNVAAIQMRKQPGAFKIVGEVGQPRLLAWVANPQDLEIRKFINDTLDELRASGKLTALEKKWFGAPMEIPRANYLPEGAI
ncbi:MULTISPECIES: transporter substrate-binding domain-containing protein [Ralstonia solanacearum species complex]|uniref:Amino-acid-binding periplasmic protein (Pbp) n=2 Tax=Ralstonia solanacearum TaxID=305 RepID=A0A7U7JD62_RALSL|nr:transporter substrate-binding domain-containing protein [Ralstonia solanacearum]ALF90862.1 Cystine-binding periplasmic protein precursor [Ralstonia solanacearum]ATI30285.1 amino acid ABC transporter substrate-binding protein [Ralstonia solanacearum]EAP72462.1 ABC Transporter Amino Acid binding protein [Ralstonia solanacearum UW551]KEI30313.1 amino acid ABC transporter substrate-binding protein [Ralstonia solanacearum]KFX78666.1 amino acid ABC transporter substrate-binding protein [Ralstonia